MCPFESIGPGATSGALEPDPDPVKEAVRKARNFYNRREVKDLVNKAEKLFNVAKDVKPSNPFSVVHALAKTADILYTFQANGFVPEPMERYEALREQGQVLCPDSASHLFVGLFPKDQCRCLCKFSEGAHGDGIALYAYDLATPEGPVAVYWYEDNFDFSDILCHRDADRAGALRALGDLVWARHGNQVEMLWGADRDFDFRAKPLPPWRYEGDFGHGLIARWKRAYAMGMRRFVVLHGPRGTGKSTLARQLGMEIAARVLYVPHETITESDSVRYFADVLNLVRPDVTIIDDMDRIGQPLEKLLALFEETENQVPFLLATTNDLDRLPDALKRPGRFDEIWEISPPSPDLLGRIVRYFAQLEDVALDEAQEAFLVALGAEHQLSGAHLRELLRRVKLEGLAPNWREMAFDARDLTFSAKWRPRAYAPEDVSVSAFEDAYEGEEDAGEDW